MDQQRMASLYNMTFHEKVAYLRANPPTAGSAGTCYQAGLEGLERVPYGARGSVGHAAYRAGKLNREQKA